MIPTCINYGCNKPVTYSHKDVQGNPRYRIHCSHCQGASYGKRPHAPGVTPYKTGKCSNTDGHLGFNCLVKWTKIPDWAKGMTEIDHIDGDHTNNDYDNLDELCPMCHKLKGQLSGDYNNTKKHNRGSINISVNKARTTAKTQFEALFGT
jgi:5-methylcytosine-specific restriction endonuclease McrA